MRCKPMTPPAAYFLIDEVAELEMFLYIRET